MYNSKKMININFEKKLFLIKFEVLSINNILYLLFLSPQRHQKHLGSLRFSFNLEFLTNFSKGLLIIAARQKEVIFIFLK